MCKNSENGAKLPISRKYAVEKWHGATALATRALCAPALACGTTSARANHGHARWPVVHGYHTGSTSNARWPVVRF